MNKKTIDTTVESDEADKAAALFDSARQFGIPDLEKWLKSAYYHGYRDALIKERYRAKLR